MSCSLVMKPVLPSQTETFAKGSTLASYFREIFDSEFPMMLTTQHIPELKAIAICGYEDVHELIDAIIKSESIEVNVEY